LSIKPPSHPWFPYEVEQSTNCYSEKDNKFLLVMKLRPSSDPVVEKAQHEPHCPWFLTPVTAPAVTQLTVAGKAETSSGVGV